MQVNAVGNNYNYPNNGRNLGFGTILKNNAPKVLKFEKDGSITDRFVCVLSGPSGVGKDSILNKFNEKYPFFSRVVTCTTRNPRPGEVNGVNYHFLGVDEFKKGIENNDFIEYQEVYTDRFYGTRERDVDAALEKGKNVVMTIDVNGATEIKKKRPDVLSIFVTLDPSELVKRLAGRGTETPAEIAERVGKASWENKFQDKYDIVIRNDKLDDSVEELAEIFGLKK